MIPTTAVADLNASTVDALVELIEIDASAPNIGAGVLRYCNQTDTNGGSVTLAGNVYTPYPILFSGLEHTAKDAAARPTLTIGNILSAWSTLVLLYQDMVGAVVTRRKILAKYLDGKPGADSTMGYAADVFTIERKMDESFDFVKFELGMGLEIEGVQIPLARCVASHCVVQYRSAECSYTGRAVADRYGNALAPGAATGAWATATGYIVGDEAYVLVDGVRYYAVCIVAHTSSSVLNLFNKTYWTADQCSKRLNTGCELRFDNDDGYPFLAFLGMLKLPV